MGFTPLRDTVAESGYVRAFAQEAGIVLVLVYVDDMLVAGPRRLAIVVPLRLATAFGCGQEPLFELKDFVGIQREVLESSANSRVVLLHQGNYARLTVEQYEREFCGGRRLGAATL